MSTIPAESRATPAKVLAFPTATEQDPRWARVVARDRAADGAFFYSVATTGVYCRPSCASRRANPKNVRFHATAAACEAAGFRPCKRCKPDQLSQEARNAEKIARACRLIVRAEEPPSLAEMAKAAGLSRYHFHRIFKAATGVTPKDYAAHNRAAKVRKELTRSRTVTEAIYDAGFNSNGRFYEKSDALLGMSPTDYRAGGAGTAIRFAVGECSLGSILVAQSDKGVCAILMGDDPSELVRNLQDSFPQAELIGADGAFEWLVGRGAAIPRSRAGSARPKRCARSPAHAPPMRWRWRSPAIASCATTAPCPAIAGASSGNAHCSIAKRGGRERTLPAHRAITPPPSWPCLSRPSTRRAAHYQLRSCTYRAAWTAGTSPAATTSGGARASPSREGPGFSSPRPFRRSLNNPPTLVHFELRARAGVRRRSPFATMALPKREGPES